MKFIPIILALLLLSGCGQGKFTVKMNDVAGTGESVALRVVLPPSVRESEITFELGGATYACASFPIVARPEYELADLADDGYRSITLRLASDMSGEAELITLSDSGEEARFSAKMYRFSPLLDFLRTN